MAVSVAVGRWGSAACRCNPGTNSTACVHLRGDDAAAPGCSPYSLKECTGIGGPVSALRHKGVTRDRWRGIAHNSASGVQWPVARRSTTNRVSLSCPASLPCHWSPRGGTWASSAAVGRWRTGRRPAGSDWHGPV